MKNNAFGHEDMSLQMFMMDIVTRNWLQLLLYIITG